MPKKEKIKLEILVHGILFLVEFKNPAQHHEFCEDVHWKRSKLHSLKLVHRPSKVICVKACDVSALIS